MFSRRRTNTAPPLHRRLTQSAFHVTVVSCATILWFWHLGEVAAQQPIAKKWGWFFNYMTFWTLSLQLVQYVLALPVDLFPNLLVSWRNFVDDFACAMFPLVLFVSCSYYLISNLPLPPLYGGDYQVVPPWVPHGLHSGNSLAAIIDLLACLEQRTFSKQAANAKTIICLGYIFWLLLCRLVTGIFAYAFMQDMPLPWGFGCAVIFMLTSCELLFGIGRQVHAVGTKQQRSHHSTPHMLRAHQS